MVLVEELGGTPLVVAGGGGGAGSNVAFITGGPGQTTPEGQTAVSFGGGGTAGCGGAAGEGYDADGGGGGSFVAAVATNVGPFAGVRAGDGAIVIVEPDSARV